MRTIAIVVVGWLCWTSPPAGPQEPVSVAPGDTVQVKGGDAGEDWWPAVTVRSVAPGPCLGAVIRRPDGFNELVTVFDSLRVGVGERSRAVARDRARLDAPGCTR